MIGRNSSTDGQIDFVFILFILIAGILEIILYIIYGIIVSKKIKIEEPYSKSVIFIWRERNKTTRISSKNYKGKEMIDSTRNKNNTQHNCHNLFIFHANNNNVVQYSIQILDRLF